MNNERQYVTNFGQSAPVATMPARRSGMAHGYTTQAGTTIGNAMYPAALGRPMPGESSPSGMRSGTVPATPAAASAEESALAVPPQLAGIYSAADWTRLGAPGRAAAVAALRPSTAQDVFDSVMRAAGLATTTFLQFNAAENVAEHQQRMDALQQQQQEFQQRIQADAAAGRIPNPADAGMLAQLQGLIARGQTLTAQPPPAAGLSTGAIVGIVAGGVAVLGGLVFVLTMRPRRNPSHKRARRAHRGY